MIPDNIPDDRFVWSPMAFGVAAACWTLAAPFLGTLPPAALAAVALTAAAALAVGRFDALAKIAAAGALAVGALGWRIAWDGGGGAGDVTVAIVSALPPGWLVWYVFYLAREGDRSGLWRNPHAVSAAMACCAVAACGAWSIGLWALGEAKIGDFRHLQALLLFVWMLSSMWCVNTAYPALKGRLPAHEGVALFGVWFAPWALGAATLVIDVAGRGPFDHILHPERTTPLWLAVVPLVIGVSALNALRVLRALLTALRLAATMRPDAPREENT